jgi:hypothetical protein
MRKFVYVVAAVSLAAGFLLVCPSADAGHLFSHCHRQTYPCSYTCPCPSPCPAPPCFEERPAVDKWYIFQCQCIKGVSCTWTQIGTGYDTEAQAKGNPPSGSTQTSGVPWTVCQGQALGSTDCSTFSTKKGLIACPIITVGVLKDCPCSPR